jgi:hypothetical protein
MTPLPLEGRAAAPTLAIDTGRISRFKFFKENNYYFKHLKPKIYQLIKKDCLRNL